jgi:excisionase family DNA binding protein
MGANAVRAGDRRFLSPGEFSALSGLSLATVHRYLKSGRLPYWQPRGRRGRILIPADALQTLAKDSLQPDPDPTMPAPCMDTNRLSGPRPRWTQRTGA